MWSVNDLQTNTSDIEYKDNKKYLNSSCDKECDDTQFL